MLHGKRTLSGFNSASHLELSTTVSSDPVVLHNGVAILNPEIY